MDEATFWGRSETFQRIKVEFLLSISKSMWLIILKLRHIVTLGIFINCIKVPILTMMLMLNVIVLTRYGLIEDGTKWHHKYKWFQEAIDRWQGFENFFLEWSCFVVKASVKFSYELSFDLVCFVIIANCVMCVSAINMNSTILNGRNPKVPLLYLQTHQGSCSRKVFKNVWYCQCSGNAWG